MQLQSYIVMIVSGLARRWGGGVGPLTAPSKVEIQLSAVCFVVPSLVSELNQIISVHILLHRPQQDNPIGSTNIVCSSHHPVLTS